MTQPSPPPPGAEAPASKTAAALRGAVCVAAFTALLWVVEAIDFVVPADLDRFGVEARSFDGLPGIFFAPLLHVDFSHLAANSVPLLVLGALTAMRGLGRFLLASLVIVVVGGAGVWLTGPVSTPLAPHVTVGASGLIFGYFGYLVGRGIFDRRLLDVAVAALVVVVYGSILWGVLPSDPNVSWQGHLFGLVGGVVAAWALRRKGASAVPVNPLQTQMR
ncbi:MAG: rhomboid family intramembrane serine protease [Stackebrandtia sp.]